MTPNVCLREINVWHVQCNSSARGLSSVMLKRTKTGWSVLPTWVANLCRPWETKPKKHLSSMIHFLNRCVVIKAENADCKSLKNSFCSGLKPPGVSETCFVIVSNNNSSGEWPPLCVKCIYTEWMNVNDVFYCRKLSSHKTDSIRKQDFHKQWLHFTRDVLKHTAHRGISADSSGVNSFFFFFLKQNDHVDCKHTHWITPCCKAEFKNSNSHNNIQTTTNNRRFWPHMHTNALTLHAVIG